MSRTTRIATLVTVGILGFGAFQSADADPPKSIPTPTAEKSQLLSDRFGDPLPPGAIRRFGTLRFRPRRVEELAFTSDGKLLIAGARDAPLAVFDAVTGQKLRELGANDPQYRNLRGFALSPDGNRVACCGPNVIFVWDVQTGRLIRRLYRSECKEAAFSPDGTKVAAIKESSGGNREVKTSLVVLEAAAEAPLLKIVAEKTIHAGDQLTFQFHGIAFSPEGKYLAGRFSELRKEKPFIYGVASSHVWLFDAATGARVRTFGSADVPIACFAFQPVSGRLATYGKDGILRFWDTATGIEVQHFRAVKGAEENSFSELRFSADGRRCAFMTDRAKYLTMLDTQDGRVIRRIEVGESGLMGGIALSADGKVVAASPRSWGWPCCVRVWDIASGVERLANAGHHAAVTDLSLSADARTLASLDEDGQRIHWDLRTGQGEVDPSGTREDNGQLNWSWDFHRKTLRGPRWRVVYTSQEQPIMEIWSLDGAKLIRKCEIPSMRVPTVALSLDGRKIAIAIQNLKGANSTVMLWEPEREDEPYKLPGNPAYCWELLFSHDGKRLVAKCGLTYGRGESNCALWNWDVASGRLVHKLALDGYPSRFLLTTDDKVLLAGIGGKDATIRAWDMESGTELVRLIDPSSKPAIKDGDPQLQAGINGLALSANDRFLSVVSSRADSSTVSVWETASWKMVRVLAPTSPRNDVKAMVFSRNGRSLFTANSDSTILEWDVSGRFGHKSDSPNRDRLIVLWQSLAETPDKAYPAMWEMADHPSRAVPCLIDKVPPIPRTEEKRVRQLIAQLDSESFSEREEASKQLQALGEQFLPSFRQALHDPASVEVKKRLQRILESLEGIQTPDQLRWQRALAVLEWCNQPDTVEHLQRLASGAPSALLTQAAKAALQRLKH